MRDVPEALTARIESGAATLCHAWLLRPGEGAAMGFTDHDRDLELDGVVCRAASGLTQGAVGAATGLAPGDMAIGGATDDRLAEIDILAGRYDGARLETWRVDWEQPDLKVRIWSGTISRIRREGDAFVAELDGPMAALERVVGRTYGRSCDARLGDVRCGVDRDAFPGLDCDKTWATCRGVFGNSVNFQGFPDIPGDDFLTVYPATGGRHDGGSRR
ncbi:DUF2163 domain-containing protein [Brevundimonas sp. VNH65]|uniref:DUF2163 domain-containing protein n=1 Tax=Brevundimonas sp. VNH65 TaxID=3400917 RepID=UPI003C0A2C8F